jgi:preprotein translocase subunit SecE
MNVNQKPAQPVQVPSHLGKRAYEFVEDVKAEFLKIQWTENEEILAYAKVVLLTTFIFGMGIYIVDVVIQRLLMSLDVIFKWLVG